MNERFKRSRSAVFKWLVLTIVFVWASSTACAQLLSNLRTDTQEWNDFQLAIPVSRQIDFGIVGTMRMGRDLNRPVDERIGAGVTFKFNQYVSASAAFIHIGMQPIKGRAIYEDRGTFPITLRVPVGKFILSDRNQFERRLRHPGIDSTRYRNRFQIEHPVGSKEIKLSIFVANEVFYDWSFNAWVRNRAQVGITKVFNKHMTTDLYYLRQNDSHSVPGDLHVIGTSFRFRL
jgi:uncharacterized protein DUF2490